MTAMYRIALIAAAFVLMLPLSARSEIKEGSVEVGLFGGYNMFESRQNLEDGFVYGGRLGYNFTRHIGIEGTVELIGTQVDDKNLTNPEAGQFGGSMNEVDLTFYHIDAVYHFMPDGNFNPFVLAGFGGAHYDPEISDKDMAAFNLGLGAKYWMTENIAARLDLRDYIISEVFQESYNNYAATLGITVAFGGERKSQAEDKAKAIVAKRKVIKDEPVILDFEDLHFDFEQATLTKKAKTILKRNIKILKKNPDVYILISGYTSASGTEEFNQKLSERRAKSVRDYIVEEGLVVPDRLEIIGYGETRPKIKEVSRQKKYSKAAKANMRVLFEIIVK